MFMCIGVEAAAEHQTIFWGAPTYDQVRIGWDETRKACGDTVDFNTSRMTATFPGGGRIVYRSLDDPDSARGHTADGIIVDEVGDVKAWAWQEVLRPMLLDTGGWLWAGGTPKGLNWFYEEWQKAEGGVTPDAAAWRAPTLGVRVTDAGLVREPHPLENPDISFSEIKALFQTMPLMTFRQEILAEFVDSGDAVFASADVEAMAAGWRGLREPSRGTRYLSAWDIGRRRDATWGMTIDWSTEPYEIVASERVLGVPYPEIQHMIERRHKAYGGRTIVESNGPGDPVIENLNVRAEPFVTTARSKVQAIEALQVLIERHLLRADIPQLTHELRAYRWDDKNLVQDGVMALAIAAAHLPAPGRVVVTYDVDEAKRWRGAEMAGVSEKVF